MRFAIPAHLDGVRAAGLARGDDNGIVDGRLAQEGQL
jgi:hypothetical protein